MIDDWSDDALHVVGYVYGVAWTWRHATVEGTLTRRLVERAINELGGLLYRDHIERGLTPAQARDELRNLRSNARAAYLQGRGLADGLSPADRIGAHVIVHDRSGRILMQHRCPAAPTAPGLWSIPGGQVKRQETPVQAAMRELAEETGLTSEHLIAGGLTAAGSVLIPCASDGRRVRHHLYHAHTQATNADITCGEGQAMQFMSPSEIRWLPLAMLGRRALDEQYSPPPEPTEIVEVDT